MPSPKLYPNQWSWDSAFTAIGYSHYVQQKAQRELLSMFEGQWGNGMLPHIIFRSGGNYFPGPERWQTALSPYAPKIETSGVTQPAVHAIAALAVYRNSKNRDSASVFLEAIFPKIITFHRYLLTARDPEKSGLVTILHPWESGFDNSLRWDDALARIEVSNLPGYERQDIKEIPPAERPSKYAYDRYVHLIELMKACRYDDGLIYERTPFKIKDVVFSSILYVANQALLEIAGIIGEAKEEIESWLKRTGENYFGYFCAPDTKYRLVYDYDLISGERVEKRTVASLVSLYTDLLSTEQARETVDWMKHSHYCTETCAINHAHLVATSVSLDTTGFSPINYWRGPVWFNINWMLHRGLKQYSFDEDAGLLKKALFSLVAEHGFYEYYNPQSGDGLGANNFSWTAALLIDLLLEES